MDLSNVLIESEETGKLYLPAAIEKGMSSVLIKAEKTGKLYIPDEIERDMSNEQFLSELAKLKNLERILVNHNTFFEDFGWAKKLNNLQSVAMYGGKVSLKYIPKSVKWLGLAYTIVENKEEIYTLLGLEHLYLDGMKDAINLDRLKENSNLDSLTLRNMDIDSIRFVLDCPRLRYLEIIGDYMRCNLRPIIKVEDNMSWRDAVNDYSYYLNKNNGVKLRINITKKLYDAAISRVLNSGFDENLIEL